MEEQESYGKSDATGQIDERENKHWIKPGMYVRHFSLPNVRITVDYVERIKNEQKNKDLIVGVRCHWIYDGEMKDGVFRTTELDKW
jgi:hypothetical protein